MKRPKNKKGVALFTVILVFAVLMIFITSIVTLTSQNLKETVNQDNRIKAYYISLAGIEYAESALMRQVGSQLYIQQFISNDKKISYHPDATNMTTFKDGKFRLTIKTVVDINKKKWIQIKSEARIDSINQDYTLYKRIDPENLSNTVMDRNGL